MRNLENLGSGSLYVRANRFQMTLIIMSWILPKATSTDLPSGEILFSDCSKHCGHVRGFPQCGALKVYAKHGDVVFPETPKCQFAF